MLMASDRSGVFLNRLPRILGVLAARTISIACVVSRYVDFILADRAEVDDNINEVVLEIQNEWTSIL